MLRLIDHALNAWRKALGRPPQSRLARRVRRQNLTYLSRRRLARLEAELSRVERQGVPGDLLEFGVALGGSAIVIASRAGSARSFHGFDVFAMIPPPSSDKDGQDALSRYALIKSGASQGLGGETYYGYRDNLYDAVTSAFSKHHLPVDGQRIVLHKGLFEDTWPLYRGQAIAFAHIDCDWYDPVRFCLEHVAERLAPGGAILLDDYHDYGGCRTAVTDFLAQRSDFQFDDGENVILRRIGGRPQG